MKTVTDEIEYAVAFAHTVMEEQGELIPMFIGRDASGSAHLIATPWGDEDSKERILSYVRAYFQVRGVRSYILVSEVWISVSSTPNPEFPPSKDPDREEALMVMHVGPGGVRQQSFAIARHPTTKKVSLHKMGFPRIGGGGRMTELLPPPDCAPLPEPTATAVLKMAAKHLGMEHS